MILTPPILNILQNDYQNNFLFGGRGSGKSVGIAQILTVLARQEKCHILCGREIQKSLRESTFSEIESVVEQEQFKEFSIIPSQGRIENDFTSSKFTFMGLQSHTVDSMKSIKDVKYGWLEECQSISQKSLKLYNPSIRMKGARKFYSFNPEAETDPIDEDMHRKCDMTKPHLKEWEWPDGQVLKWVEFYGESDYEFNGEIFKEKNIAIHMNYEANPYFKETSLVTEMMNDRNNKPVAEFEHIWHGAYLKRTDSLVFDQNKLKIWDFEEHQKRDLLFGVDWGWNDPVAGIRCYEADGQLWITHECGGVHLTNEKIIEQLKTLPDMDRCISRGDCAEPGKIDMCNRNGFPRMVGCVKKFKSRGGENKLNFIETGVSHIRTYSQINVHPRCENFIREYGLYSYKVDSKTDEVLNEIEDDNNHWFDALRYALEPKIKMNTSRKVRVIYG